MSENQYWRHYVKKETEREGGSIESHLDLDINLLKAKKIICDEGVKSIADVGIRLCEVDVLTCDQMRRLIEIDEEYIGTVKDILFHEES